jgi:tRNA nucleotidyltransferase (CCA-adding enzyme)
LGEAEAAYDIPFHFDDFAILTDVDINGWLGGLEIGDFGQMGLLVLVLYSVVGAAPIDILAVNANTHAGLALTTKDSLEISRERIRLFDTLAQAQKFCTPPQIHPLISSVPLLYPKLMLASPLSPQTWPFSLTWLPNTACLVGGSVRDALLDRTSDYLDLDFILPEGAVETAQAIARHYKAGFVLLDAERQIARVVFAQGTADFAQQCGDSLVEDLERRDFRVNAIAYNPHTAELIDPLGGKVDLDAGILRMVSAENLAEDPLRLLRAYRQAAQLGFAIEPQTRKVIQRLASTLNQIAAERVQSELNYLLSSEKGTLWLDLAREDGLLSHWFPDSQRQGLVAIGAMDDWFKQIKQTQPELAAIIGSSLRSGKSKSKSEAPASGSTRTWLSLAKLVCLLPKHSQAAEDQLRQLKYSRNEIQAALTALDRYETLTRFNDTTPIADQFHFFQSIGQTFPSILLLTIAQGIPMVNLRSVIDRYLDKIDPVAYPSAILTGQDLMRELNLSPSPKIGQILAALQLARAEGVIVDRLSALTFAKGLIETP